MVERTQKIFEYSTNHEPLRACLSKPSTQRVLYRKPGDKGFSLIELVVVVAVLALAAIAVPQFASMNERAANAAAQTNLKNATRNAITLSTPGSPLVYTALTDDAYFTTPRVQAAAQQPYRQRSLPQQQQLTAQESHKQLQLMRSQAPRVVLAFPESLGKN